MHDIITLPGLGGSGDTHWQTLWERTDARFTRFQPASWDQPDLHDWERKDGALRRSIKFSAFLDGIDAVRRVGERAEQKDHHPDIDIRWRTVTFALVTHSEGGITDKDVEMAKEIDGIVGQ